jgi:sugar (pentulose or hexulose) kinase
MKFENNLKSYSKNQRQWCSEQTWFDIKDTIHAIISKSKLFSFNKG